MANHKNDNTKRVAEAAKRILEESGNQTPDSLLVLDPKSVVLKVDLELIDNTGTVAKVKQDINIPYVKEPAFIKGAYTQIENTLDIVCVNFFKKLIKQYCLKTLDEIFSKDNSSSPYATLEGPQFETSGYLSNSSKIVVRSEQNTNNTMPFGEPIEADNYIEEGGGGGKDGDPDSSGDVLNLDVET